MILHEAVSGGSRARRTDHGAWIAGAGTEWRIHSSANAEYSEFDAGREAVVAWARGHAPRVGLISPGRCIVVADAGNGFWRLWQIVRIAPSLRHWLLDMAYDADDAALLDALSLAARTLYEASIHPKSAGLPMTFDSIGRGDRGAQFVGLMPDPESGFEDTQVPDPDACLRNLHRQLKALLQLEFWDLLPVLGAAAVH